MRTYEQMQESVRSRPRRWLVTGAAGFIGSHLVEALLKLDQTVTGLDNFSTGNRDNLTQVSASIDSRRWEKFRFIEGDIRSADQCRRACENAEIVLHQAARGSVPRSIEDPVGANENNVSGFLQMLAAARDAGVARFVYASSSATYGDHPAIVKSEPESGRPLSPYGATKQVNELYADVFARCYGFDTIGLRYFNVFGARQDPDGAYAAVIPKWISQMLRGGPVFIYGDGETARDFCYVDNAVQANLLAAEIDDRMAVNQIYNVAVNASTTLNRLFEMIRSLLEPQCPHLREFRPIHREFRAGDVRHSQADISKAERLLGYRPAWRVEQGLARAVGWYAGKGQRASRINGPVPGMQAVAEGL
jgi:UDP-N-acetylglucosamine 4-epimerase